MITKEQAENLRNLIEDYSNIVFDSAMVQERGTREDIEEVNLQSKKAEDILMNFIAELTEK